MKWMLRRVTTPLDGNPFLALNSQLNATLLFCDASLSLPLLLDTFLSFLDLAHSIRSIGRTAKCILRFLSSPSARTSFSNPSRSDISPSSIPFPFFARTYLHLILDLPSLLLFLLRLSIFNPNSDALFSSLSSFSSSAVLIRDTRASSLRWIFLLHPRLAWTSPRSARLRPCSDLLSAGLCSLSPLSSPSSLLGYLASVFFLV